MASSWVIIVNQGDVNQNQNDEKRSILISKTKRFEIGMQQMEKS
jgi:hypothetical protein